MLAEERAGILIIWREGGKEKKHFYKETWYLKKAYIFIYKPSTLYSNDPQWTPKARPAHPIYLNLYIAIIVCFVYLTAHPVNQ